MDELNELIKRRKELDKQIEQAQAELVAMGGEIYSPISHRKVSYLRGCYKKRYPEAKPIPYEKPKSEGQQNLGIWKQSIENIRNFMKKDGTD